MSKHCYHDNGKMQPVQPPNVGSTCCHCGKAIWVRAMVVSQLGPSHGGYANFEVIRQAIPDELLNEDCPNAP